MINTQFRVCKSHAVPRSEPSDLRNAVVYKEIDVVQVRYARANVDRNAIELAIPSESLSDIERRYQDLRDAGEKHFRINSAERTHHAGESSIGVDNIDFRFVVQKFSESSFTIFLPRGIRTFRENPKPLEVVIDIFLGS
jgi:hypothetical protein